MPLKSLIPQSIRDAVAWKMSRKELHAEMKSSEMGQIIHSSFNYRGAGVFKHIYALQKESEIRALADLVQKTNPKVIVEIGTAKGGTLFVWTRSNPQLELIVSIDLPGGNFGGGYDSRREKLYQEFVADRPNAKMILMRCDSHSDDTLATLAKHLAGRKIDFLWIDGDHVYDGVKKDFEMYRTLVRPGGLVAFHDIVTKGDGHAVFQLWDELKTRFPAQEFVEDRNSEMGIGVLKM